jgi:hypothetical protein
MPWHHRGESMNSHLLSELQEHCYVSVLSAHHWLSSLTHSIGATTRRKLSGHITSFSLTCLLFQLGFSCFQSADLVLQFFDGFFQSFLFLDGFLNACFPFVISGMKSGKFLFIIFSQFPLFVC